MYMNIYKSKHKQTESQKACNAIHAGDKKSVILSTASIIAFCFANGMPHVFWFLNKQACTKQKNIGQTAFSSDWLS